jgi:hypothetical protein
MTSQTTGWFFGGRALDYVDPAFPSVPLEDPTPTGERKHSIATWTEWLYREPTNSIGTIANLGPELFLSTFRRVYGRTPDIDAAGMSVVSEAEMLEMAAALWPECRKNHWNYSRRCKAAKALKALRLSG